MRAAARVALALLLACSLALSGWTARELARMPVAQWFTDRAFAGIAPAMERATARYATPEAVAARLAELLDESPRNWAAIEAVEDLAEERDIALPEGLRARRTKLWEADSGWIAAAARCAACLYDTGACDLRALLAYEEAAKSRAPYQTLLANRITRATAK